MGEWGAKQSEFTSSMKWYSLQNSWEEATPISSTTSQSFIRKADECWKKQTMSPPGQNISMGFWQLLGKSKIHSTTSKLLQKLVPCSFSSPNSSHVPYTHIVLEFLFFFQQDDCWLLSVMWNAPSQQDPDQSHLLCEHFKYLDPTYRKISYSGLSFYFFLSESISCLCSYHGAELELGAQEVFEWMQKCQKEFVKWSKKKKSKHALWLCFVFFACVPNPLFYFYIGWFALEWINNTGWLILEFINCFRFLMNQELSSLSI